MKVAFFIDGWFMRKRIHKLTPFEYTGENIREYCKKHLTYKYGECLYRMFYYDSEPLNIKGHHPISGKHVDYSKSDVAKRQTTLLESIKNTPQFALRLGTSKWSGKGWTVRNKILTDILKKKISVDDLDPNAVKPLVQQKMVDMKFGLDIAEIAMKGLVEKIVVIAGDMDMVPALKFARRQGITVVLDPLWNTITPELAEHVDFVTCKIRKN